MPKACERGQRLGCLVCFSHVCRHFRPVMEVPTLKPLSEDQARFYFQDLIKGIEYCKRGLWEASLPGVVSIPRWWWWGSGKFPISLLEHKEVGGKQNCLRCRVTGSCREPLLWPCPGQQNLFFLSHRKMKSSGDSDHLSSTVCTRHRQGLCLPHPNSPRMGFLLTSWNLSFLVCKMVIKCLSLGLKSASTHQWF